MTIPFLLILALNQFNWLQELQKREQERIEHSMINSANLLAKRIQDEVFYLPNILRIRPDEYTDIKQIFMARYKLWDTYAKNPSVINKVYVIDGETGTCLLWQSNSFVPAEQTAELKNIIASVHKNKSRESKAWETDECIQILMPISMQNEPVYIYYIIDRKLFYTAVIPQLAKESFDTPDLYAYRLINSKTGSILYTSLKKYRDSIFAKPDIEISLANKMHFPGDPPIQLSEKLNLSEQLFSSFPFFSGNKQGEYSREEPSTSNTGINSEPRPSKRQDQLFSDLVLQIVNKDASLTSIYKRATIQNAVLSFGIVVLLIIVLMSMAETSRRARQLACSQQEFIATITHELKTPLAVISSAAQNLGDGLVRDDKKIKQYGVTIQKEASRLSISIEDFLLYSNANDRSRMKPVVCDLTEIIQSILKATEEERKQGDFRTEISLPAESVYVKGDRIALESVFQNLVQNVLRHASQGRYLGIIVSISQMQIHGKIKQNVIIKIRDKGPGISQREQKSIFEPFVRGKRAMENQIPGNGIGLNLVKRIIIVHDGTITVESKPDNGSVFIITLPVCKGVFDDEQNSDD